MARLYGADFGSAAQPVAAPPGSPGHDDLVDWLGVHMAARLNAGFRHRAEHDGEIEDGTMPFRPNRRPPVNEWDDLLPEMPAEWNPVEAVGLFKADAKEARRAIGDVAKAVEAVMAAAGHETGTALAAWWQRVQVSAGCWLWLGSRSSQGIYGQLTHPELTEHAAHRIGYVLLVGPIPDGMELHHKCGLTLCVRPDHLEVVTEAEHRQRHAAKQVA